MIFKISLILIVSSFAYSAELPTLYEHYTSGGIKSGLKAEGNHFTLNGKEITIFSGSFHYFRVHHLKWRETLLKFKAAGLNAVQIYSPWNLHEEIPGHFDFENGMLNLTDFFQAVKEADMFAMYRPGPYICAEWDLGGFPSWLLRDPNMRLRSNYKPYLDAVEKYFDKLMAVIKKFEFTTNRGPIIALQIENEFGGYGNTITNHNDTEYFKALEKMVTKNGFKELLYTSDPWATKQGTLPNFLETINLNGNALNLLKWVKELQPNRPLYVAEYWSGWFDNWGQKHHTMAVQNYTNVFEDIVFHMNSSVNIYMFIGGTNFGFMSGSWVTTSYDYDAPLSESGNYTDKYWKTKELIEKFTKERNLPKLRIPEPPKAEAAAHYGVVKVTDYLSFSDLLSHVKSYKSEYPMYTELLDIGPNYGQNFGFTVYRTTIPKSKNLRSPSGHIGERTAVVIDGRHLFTVYESNKEVGHDLGNDAFTKSGNDHTLDLVVENVGRPNGGQGMNSARKGIGGDVLIDDKVHKNWQIFPLDFKPDFINKLKNEKWRPLEAYKSPALYRATLDIKDTPKDTFLKLDDWHTTVVFINGFNLGRYWNIGPAKTLYVPSGVLKKGFNDIYLFENYNAGNQIEFVDKPNLG